MTISSTLTMGQVNNTVNKLHAITLLWLMYDYYNEIFILLPAFYIYIFDDCSGSLVI